MLLGPAPVPLGKVLACVTSGFPYGAPRTDQSRAIKRALDVMGRSLGYTTFFCDNSNRGHEREWVLDLVWWNHGSGAAAAMLCDWGNAGSVAAQFQKLMAIKAPLKVMVFSTRKAGSERPDVLQRKDPGAMLQALGTCMIDFNQHVAGEHYLLLEVAEDENVFRAFELLIAADGKLGVPFKAASQVFRPLAHEAGAA